jgi:hypothetical protein
MNREVHVRFWEGLGVRFHRATQLARYAAASGFDMSTLRKFV